MATDHEVLVPADGLRLPGYLSIPDEAIGVVLFAHGSGSGRHSPRNRFVASVLQDARLGTLLFDLLTPEEENDRANVFDIALLGSRLTQATSWLRAELGDVPVGWFGASTGAGAALWAAGSFDAQVAAIVSRGGRPDLAGDLLGTVRAPTLLIVGGLDTTVVELNRAAQARLKAPSEVRIVPGATHLFEEPGTLDIAAGMARDWFVRHLGAASSPPGVRAQETGDAMALPGDSGFRLEPHTADIMISAWAPTVDDCLAEAARGLVASFADVGAQAPTRMLPFTCEPGPEPELLVELLEEVIYVVDSEDAVPVHVDVSHDDDGGLVGEFGVVDLSTVEVIGPAPKAVTRHDLRFDYAHASWHCQAIVDV